MFAIVLGAFIGFASTAIYAEETRDPRRTVPRATFLAIFYTVMAWIAVSAFGKSEVVNVAGASPTEMYLIAAEQYVGHAATVVMEVLLITSAFVSTLAFHNTASRYMFTLSREGLLPSRLYVVHARNTSPYVASATQTAGALVVVGLFVAAEQIPTSNSSCCWSLQASSGSSCRRPSRHCRSSYSSGCRTRVTA